MLPVLRRILSASRSRVAVSSENGSLTYEELILRSQAAARRLKKAFPPQEHTVLCRSPAGEAHSAGRVSLLDAGSLHFVTSLLGTWMAGLASVPLCKEDSRGDFFSSPLPRPFSPGPAMGVLYNRL